MWQGSLFLWVVMAILSGCAMIGPNFNPPEAPLAPKWQETEGAYTRSDTKAYDSRWWEVFNDPVLNKLIELAYQQNLTLQIAGLRVLEARAQLGVVVGSLYPQVQQATGSYSYNRASGGGAEPYFSGASIGFDAGWELDFWGKFRRSIQSADANLMANMAGYDDALVTLTAEVARAYVQIRTFEERIRLAEENIRIQKRALEISEARFKSGAVSELDVQQARTLLNTTRAAVPAFQILLRQTQHALSVLLGMPPQDLDGLLEGPRIIPDAPVQVAVGVPADLLKRRPDIRQAELQAVAQCSRIGVAKADLFPSISLLGSLGWSTTDAGRSSLGDLFQSSSFGFSVGPSFQWNLFNYGRITNSVRVQDARFQQTLTLYRNTVLNAAREVEDAMTGFMRSKIQAVYQEESVKAAQRTSEISLIQYTAGTIAYESVLTSTQSLSQQQDQYAQTKGNIALNLVAMYKALGGGWEVRMGNDLVPAPIREQMKQRTDWGGLLDMQNQKPDMDVSKDRDLWRTPDW
ncbi:efflux transporter, outer membrane factor lipoprotein, NodT family [delta proteobacterium NaphS2]|nr:efflux transporter, outer membrane factor lipoprotein, NodT family [delta proteobacterium NaphS2]